ncbi:hypothetical protein M0802_006321 [Mischocyttarus mexicanus]|nr:hypothetical protein M0802_006321 [Mischocyttarus mexicanus]
MNGERNEEQAIASQHQKTKTGALMPKRTLVFPSVNGGGRFELLITWYLRGGGRKERERELREKKRLEANVEAGTKKKKTENEEEDGKERENRSLRDFEMSRTTKL